MNIVVRLLLRPWKRRPLDVRYSSKAAVDDDAERLREDGYELLSVQEDEHGVRAQFGHYSARKGG